MSDSWVLKAIEEKAVERALQLVLNPDYVAARMRVLGLSFAQIAFLRGEWLKAHPGEEVPECHTTK